MSRSDRELVARVLRGEPEHFHELVDRHAGPLWSSIRSSVRNVEDAREILQETWLRAFERLDSLREPERLRSWLLSIALNLVRQRHRRRDVFEPEAAASLDEVVAEGTPAADAAAERGDEVARLRERIAALPPRQREVLDLRLTHELDHAAIGRLLGITPENSRANYYQAVRKLRAAEDPPTTK